MWWPLLQRDFCMFYSLRRKTLPINSYKYVLNAEWLILNGNKGYICKFLTLKNIKSKHIPGRRKQIHRMLFTKHKQVHRNKSKKSGMANRHKLYHLLLKTDCQVEFIKINKWIKLYFISGECKNCSSKFNNIKYLD